LIELYEEEEQFDRALEYADRLVETEPNNDEYLYRLAWVYQKAGRNDEAVTVLRRVLELNPDNGSALNFLGYTLAERGENLEEAERLIRRALEIHPNDGFFVDSLGWVYYQRGEYAAAVHELERASKLAGNDPVISEHLADAYVKVGRVEDAVRSYRDCEARTEDPAQRQRVLDKLLKLEGRAESTASGI
jgi:Flp pilus assembly protein TadD